MDVYDVTMGYDVTMETGGNHGNGVRQTVESLQNRLIRRHRTMEIITMDHNGLQWLFMTSQWAMTSQGGNHGNVKQ